MSSLFLRFPSLPSRSPLRRPLVTLKRPLATLKRPLATFKRPLVTLKAPLSQPENAEETSAVYQDSFSSFDQMIWMEKTESKHFIMLEDVSRKLVNTDPTIVSKVLDWPVSKVYRVKVARDHFFLLKLSNYGEFFKKKKPHLSDSLPVKSRMVQVRNVSHVPEAGVANCEPGEESEAGGVGSGVGGVGSGVGGVGSGVGGVDGEKGMEAELEHLSRSKSLTEYGSKVRFFLVNQLEEMLCAGLFSSFSINPFGSSVNGFGSDSSDLDMAFESATESVESAEKNPESAEKNPESAEKNPESAEKNPESAEKNPSLAYCSKEMLSSREVSKRLVMTFSDMISSYIPGSIGVTGITRARVPIVRMYSRFTGLDCDIAFLSSHSTEMARILFSLNKIEPRLRHLVVFGRMWLDQINRDSRNIPGYYVSNFMLTVMIINFLQTHQDGPLLPSVKDLNRSLLVKDLNRSLLVKDLKRSLPVKDLKRTRTGSELSTRDLLEKFFEFLATFDFQGHGMSILNSKYILKSTHSPMYVENPCDIEHNICRNVTLDELGRVKKAAERTVQVMTAREEASIGSVLAAVGEVSKGAKSSVMKPFTHAQSVSIKDFWK